MTTRKSRRDFIRTTAGAAAAVSAMSGSAWAEYVGCDDPVPQGTPGAAPAAGEPVRIGVIGTGGMGTGHVEAFARFARNNTADVRVEALCDVCEPRLQAAKKKLAALQDGDVATYGQARDLLARTDIHGVVIASPEHWHARHAEEALLAGKDVYVEKPMTLNLKDALRLRKVVQKHPERVFVVGTQYVMTPSYSAAQQLIAEGTIGKPVWSQTSYCRNSKDGEWLYYEIDPEWKPGVNLDWKTWCGPLGQAPWDPAIYARWRRYRRYSTGIIGDLLVHQITPMIMAMNLGWPTRVVASGGHYIDKAMENHDQVNINVEFEDEHTMIVAGSTCNELGLEKVIHGRKGNLFVGGQTATLRPEQLFADEVDERQIPAAGRGDSQNNLRLAWLDCIRTRKPSPSPVDLGTKVMVIVDLATRSLWEGGAFGYVPEKHKVYRI
ncbi:MAG TPA: Gfo/Idh/MocA family oxidoreductase [Vicinamibacterales bacterium]|nr:Gfo/Idh/MocA family oxidoreductase [Vicinamibacterales bacterium]